MSLTIGQDICQSLFSVSFCEQYSEATLQIGGGLLAGTGALCLKLIHSAWSTPAKPLSDHEISANPETELGQFVRFLKERGFEFTQANQLKWDVRYLDFGIIRAGRGHETNEKEIHPTAYQEAMQRPVMWGKTNQNRHFFTFRVALQKQDGEILRYAFTVEQSSNEENSRLDFSYDGLPIFDRLTNIYGHTGPELRTQEQFEKFIKGEVLHNDMRYLREENEYAQYSYWLDIPQVKKSVRS